MKKNILVTGGAGFIGSHLVRNLISEDVWNVSVVDNLDDFYSPEIKLDNIQQFIGKPNFNFNLTDICEEQKLRTVFAEGNFDVVVHLAARAGVRRSLHKPKLYLETNVHGTLSLLELSKEFGIKQFIFGSSSSVYGENCESPFSEELCVSKPISPYAVTKIAAEALCHTYSHLYDLRTVCLRFFTVYGARQRPDLAIYKFARLIAEGKPISVFGDGTTRRDYTYIDDIIRGIRAAIDYDQSDHEVINLGKSQTTELNKLISLLEKHLGKKAIVDRKPQQPGDVPYTCADISKARRLLGYCPSTTVEEGLAKFVKWFEE